MYFVFHQILVIRLLAIQLQFNGKNSVSKLSMYTDMFIAKPSEPKIFPDF